MESKKVAQVKKNALKAIEWEPTRVAQAVVKFLRHKSCSSSVRDAISLANSAFFTSDLGAAGRFRLLSTAHLDSKDHCRRQ